MGIKYSQLTDKERYTIELLLQENYGQKDIAKRIERSGSTISREINRNSANGKYNALLAINHTAERRIRKHKSKFTELSRDKIEDKLRDGWSPEQISSYLKKKNIVAVSHELIYQYIDNDRKAGGKLYTYLPRRGEKYKKRNIKNRIQFNKSAPPRRPISERAAKEELKLEIGHWEGDTIEGKGHNSGIATLVDIKSKFSIFRKVKDKTSTEMKDAIINSFFNCPSLIKTMTVDNGNEFAKHNEIGKELNADIYFANAYSPWERGLNENTNGLLRRFYPKGTDFRKVTERELLKIQDLLNNRPRKTLGFRTPREVFMQEVLKENKYKELLKIV